jgi:hypothetical protein
VFTCRVYWDRSRGTLDDTLGGYMTTLVDSLDTLIIMKEFDRYVTMHGIVIVIKYCGLITLRCVCVQI